MEGILNERKAAARMVFDETGVVSALDGRTSTPTDTQDIGYKLNKLEKLHKKELSKWCEICSLEKYIEVQRVPRGLRIHVVPTYENTNPLLLKDWAGLMAETCRTMILMLIKYAKIDLVETQKEIEEVRKDLDEHPGTDKVRIITFLENMKTKLNKLEDEIKERKRRKFLRDKVDYEQGRILTFNRRFDMVRQNTSLKPMEPLQELATIDSSEVSTDSESEKESNIGATRTVPSVMDEYRLIHQDHFHVARSRGRSRGRGGRGKTRGRGGARGAKDNKTRDGQ